MESGQGGGRWRPVSFVFLLALILAGCGSTAEGGSLEPALPSEREQIGARLFGQYCASCHSTVPETDIVGPSLAGIGARAGNRVAGLDARSYLATSISDPSAYLVEGYDDLMPAGLHDSLTAGEMEALVAYLLSLK